jgi:ATP-dependent DNA helicase PIF1
MEKLNEEQSKIFKKFLNRENIFVTGPGGSGKSFLIKEIYNHAEANNIKIKVCAMTGCAAILLKCKATTLHSFAGIGLANKSIDQVVRSVLDNKNKVKNWKSTEVLIIDEVSMLSLKLLLILDEIGRKIYNNHDKPFGGLQVIFTGDFYQLPPVCTNDDDKEGSMFCFQHELWNQIFPKENQICLTSIFRQNDAKLIKALNYIRKGKITKSTLELLESRVKTTEEINEIKKNKVLTILSPIKRDVDNINKISFENLNNKLESVTYNIKYVTNEEEIKINTGGGSKMKHNVDGLCDDFENLFKKSPMYTKFEYEFLTNNIMADKSLTLKVGTHVMCIANVDLQSDNQIANGSQGIVTGFKNNLPLVKFNNIDYPILVGYYTWKSENNDKIAVAQIPLIYAWAITIHKAQGVTLDSALIDIGSNIFEYGQSYVALSRVKTLEGIYLCNLDYKKIMANPVVKEFYNYLN